MTFLTDIVTNFLSVVSQMFQGIGEGLVDLFKSVMLTETGGLNEMGVWIVVFMGFSFSLTVVWKLLRKVL